MTSDAEIEFPRSRCDLIHPPVWSECGGVYPAGKLMCSRCGSFRGGWIRAPYSVATARLANGLLVRIWTPLDTRFPVRRTLLRADGVPIKSITERGYRTMLARASKDAEVAAEEAAKHEKFLRRKRAAALRRQGSKG